MIIEYDMFSGIVHKDHKTTVHGTLKDFREAR